MPSARYANTPIIQTSNSFPRKYRRAEILTELVSDRGLKQKDLIPVFGSQGLASEVLNGKRGISKTQAKALEAV
jgi:antitoxin component HigA of HigAB toxin-antitoxin module